MMLQWPSFCLIPAWIQRVIDGDTLWNCLLCRAAPLPSWEQRAWLLANSRQGCIFSFSIYRVFSSIRPESLGRPPSSLYFPTTSLLLLYHNTPNSTSTLSIKAASYRARIKVRRGKQDTGRVAGRQGRARTEWGEVAPVQSWILPFFEIWMFCSRI